MVFRQLTKKLSYYNLSREAELWRPLEKWYHEQSLGQYGVFEKKKKHWQKLKTVILKL